MDEAVDMSGSSPTKLIRNILMVFFSPQTLANSSAFGTRKFQALDKPILRACLSKYPYMLLFAFHFIAELVLLQNL